jgi:hypothetical protein
MEVVEVVEVVDLVEAVVEIMVLMWIMVTEDRKEVEEEDLGIDLVHQHYKPKVRMIVMGMLIFSLQHRLQYQV